MSARGFPNAPFCCAELELAAPTPLQVPPGHHGFGVLVRQDGDPVGYCLRRLSPGAVVSPEQIVEWAAEGFSPVVVPPDASPGSVADEPSITIAVCTRNRPDRLVRCLAAISRLEGLDRHVDVLVVDNASSDSRTRDTVGADASARYVYEPVPGLDFARNRAVAESSATLVAFIDDDALVDRRWLRALRRAWAANPDAGGLTGSILPWELRTPAQVLFELRGGFGRSFQPMRYGRTLGEDPYYPCHAGIFGSGCNMVFRRDLLRELGGFDEALDTGPPLPASGDLDMFFRVVMSGHPLVYAPQMAVFHEHRLDPGGLTYQMWTWGLGMMTFVQKHQRYAPVERERFARLVRTWFRYKTRELRDAVLRPARGTGPVRLVAAELLGGAFAFTGEYGRSVRRVAERKRRFGTAP